VLLNGGGEETHKGEKTRGGETTYAEEPLIQNTPRVEESFAEEEKEERFMKNTNEQCTWMVYLSF